MGNTAVITVKSAVQDTKSYTYGFLLDQIKITKKDGREKNAKI